MVEVLVRVDDDNCVVVASEAEFVVRAGAFAWRYKNPPPDNWREIAEQFKP